MKIFAVPTQKKLAHKTAQLLNCEVLQSHVGTYSDGEIFIEIKDTVYNQDIFLIHSVMDPVNTSLMELLLSLDALKRSSARKITLVCPYLAYARQDRKSDKNGPIAAKLVADLITKAGAQSLLTIDIHQPQIQGFFDIPVKDLPTTQLFSQHIQENFSNLDISEDMIIISADIGGAKRARAIAESLNCTYALIDKKRISAGRSQVMHVTGHVNGKHCILVDDLLDSGETLSNAAKELKKLGAHSVYAYATHGVLSQGVSNLNSVDITKYVISDSIPLKNDSNGLIEQISLSPLISMSLKDIVNI